MQVKRREARAILDRLRKRSACRSIARAAQAMSLNARLARHQRGLRRRAARGEDEDETGGDDQSQAPSWTDGMLVAC